MNWEMESRDWLWSVERKDWLWSEEEVKFVYPISKRSKTYDIGCELIQKNMKKEFEKFKAKIIVLKRFNIKIN